MTATPDGISFSDLQKHADEARKREEDVTPKGPTFDGKTPEQIQEIVDTAANDLIEQCHDPMVHKAMIMELVERMISWHSNASIQQMEDDDLKSALFWSRDAGKFQAIANILSSVSMGPGDYLMN